jgi:hypothetical protein
MEECGMLPKDPVMLLSAINLKLRDYYQDLDTLCEDMDVEKEDIVRRLETIDYHYNSERNQFV